MSALASDYDYEYPPEAVAQVPAARREDARLLVVPRFAVERDGAPRLHDGAIPDLLERLRPGDLLVVNDVRVAPARLPARRESTGGFVSLLVLEAEGAHGLVLAGTRGTLRPGERLLAGGAALRLLEACGDGRFRIACEDGLPLQRLMDGAGRMPLPPYVQRGRDGDPRDELDRRRYQTAFARGDVPASAAAAPTAGLHLSLGLLAALAEREVEVARLRLDVGTGTFTPLRGERLDEHVMHDERYEIPEALAARYAAARRERRRVVAVGTTVVRALESAVSPSGDRLAAGAASTRLFVRPGHRFAAVDALLTNFHQPRSTLLVLVAAFAGLATVRAAYAHAVAHGYRLFSYGDAMLLEGDPPR